MAKTPTVLLVEDDEAYRYALGRGLEEGGCEVIGVGTYDAALAVLEGERRVDLMVTDVVLPQVHGFFLARLAAVRRPGLPVIYISGVENLPRHEVEFGLGRVIRKPDEVADLVAEVIAELRTLPD